MHASAVAGAAWIVAAAPSKVPFYVIGGLLACGAVALAATGITHPYFPRSERAARGVMLGTGALVVATIASAVLTSGKETQAEAGAASAPAPPAAGTAVQLSADPSGRLAFQQKRAAAAAGNVTIRFDNRSAVPHNVTIAQGSRVVAATRTIAQARADVSASLRPGTYLFYCSVDGHRQAGMQGSLTVR